MIEAAYDLHVHSMPSVFPRAMDGLELVRHADAAGMAGVMLKSHYEPTALRAAMINRYSGCRAQAYGALVLNWPVGGLNIYAVQNALRAGAKIIWMPTRDSKNSLAFGNMEGDFFNRPGISILNEEQKLLPVVYDIMDVIKEHDAALATGHLNPAESLLLCREGRKRGVRMSLTHPEFPRTLIEPEQQRELAELGVYIEKCWYNVAHNGVSVEEMARRIRLVGFERTFLSTDRGQKGQPCAVSELLTFCERLSALGFTRTEIHELVHTVPGSIVNQI